MIETAALKRFTHSHNTNMREEKVENEKKHQIKISSKQCEGARIRRVKSKATRNIKTKALAETSVNVLRKKSFTILSNLNGDFCMP